MYSILDIDLDYFNLKLFSQINIKLHSIKKMQWFWHAGFWLQPNLLEKIERLSLFAIRRCIHRECRFIGGSILRAADVAHDTGQETHQRFEAVHL